MSSAAVLTRRPAPPRRISVQAVRAALEDVVAEHPGRVDRRAEDDLPAKYIDQGKPSCLVAMVLVKLGFSVPVIRALDQEPPRGSISKHTGVRIHESRHPALKKIQADARVLLQYVQDRQDAGERWDQIVADAFRPNVWLRRWDEKRRPWLYC